MNAPTRSEVAATQREIRQDARREWRLVLQAGIALVLVAAGVVLRELLLR